ncbi:MAG: hypothetical protein ABFD29_02090 [Anaerolineaceae bacterium]|jgi:hypothetical protein
MKTKITRFAGALLMFAAILGFVFSFTGIYYVWKWKPVISTQITDLFERLSDGIATSLSLIDTIDKTLINVKEDVNLIISTTENVAITLDVSSDMALTTSTIMRENLPEIINGTQQALDSASLSAKLIDDTLGVVTSFPLFKSRYAPEVPLHQSMEDISASLNPLPITFSKIGTDLKYTSTSLEMVKNDLFSLSKSTTQIISMIDSTQTTVQNIHSSLSSLQPEIQNIKSEIPGILTSAAVILTIILIWMAITQIGLFTQGVDLFHKYPIKKISLKEDSDDPGI